MCVCVYPLISQLRESVHYDTKHNVQTNGGYDDEERYIVEES